MVQASEIFKPLKLLPFASGTCSRQLRGGLRHLAGYCFWSSNPAHDYRGLLGLDGFKAWRMPHLGARR